MSKQAPVDPRIAPKEMIVTRNKSALQKRQLREKDRSMKKITQLLKSPTNRTYKNTKKKSPKSIEKRTVSETVSPESKKEESDNEFKEYYPDKLRRRFEAKRVFLRPKYESKTVVKLNKRKMGTPQRGFLTEGTEHELKSDEWSSYKSQLCFNEMSMEDMVRIVEETESLDDEDLMEILTCPSPVWWEDPPDDNYTEDPIYDIVQTKPKNAPINNSKKEKSKTNNKKSNKQAKAPSTTEFVTIEKTDKDFLKKRNKLESVLGNIKNKTTFETKTTKENSDSEIVNEMYKESKSRKEKTYSESTGSFPDLSLNEDEMLKELENMDIPIASGVKNDDSTLIVNISDDISDVNKDLNYDVEMKKVDVIETMEKCDSPTQIPSKLPRLTKRPKLGLQESPSIKSVSDNTDMSSPSERENVDTISDTNIKFIIDDDIEIIGDNLLKDGKEMKKENTDVEKADTEVLKALKDKKDFITVYKIVSNDSVGSKFKNLPEYSSYVDNLANEERSSEESKCSGKLNTFFKKCKFASRRKRKEVENVETESNESSFCDTCEPKKCITVAHEENVKYCLYCSSIFDTDECSYCIKSVTNVKESNENQT